MKLFVILFLLIILGTSCFLFQNNVTEVASEEVKSADDTPYIQTYIFKVTQKEGEKKPFISLENVIEAKGFLKKSQGFNPQIPKEGFLFEFVNAQNQVIEQAFADNPLDKHFEVPAEDGHLERVNVKVKEEVLSVRVNVTVAFSKVNISTLDNEQTTFLTSISLE